MLVAECIDREEEVLFFLSFILYKVRSLLSSMGGRRIHAERNKDSHKTVCVSYLYNAGGSCRPKERYANKIVRFAPPTLLVFR